jgi:phytoene desaturase
MRRRVVIVGAGLGGLSAACHLAGRGAEVTVLERGDRPGGRSGLLTDAGYTFDTGPAVLTMRGVLEDTFRAADAELTDHLDLVRLDPAYRASFWDGSQIHVRAGREAMRDEVRMLAGDAEVAGFDTFVAWITKLYDTEFDAFIDRDLASPLDLLRTPGALARLAAMGGFGRLQHAVNRHFADERLRRLFSFQAMYAGLTPMQALAMYSVITYLDTVEGVWFPRGGMHEVPRALADAATKAGVQFQYGAEVEQIVPSRGGRPARVLTDAGPVDAEVIVANPDLPAVYEQLTAVDAPRRLRKGHFSPSCVLWLVGGKRAARPPGAHHTGSPSGAHHTGSPSGAHHTGSPSGAHHTIHFGEAWESTFDELTVQGRPMTDPARFVTAPSVTDPRLAPAGHDALHILEPVPNLGFDLDWTDLGPRLTERMLDWAQETGHLDGDPVVLHTTTPVGWQQQGMAAGTPFALDHRFTQSGPFRPHMTDGRLPGIVFVGSGTRPGVGIPMVLISGRLAAAHAEAHLER